MPANNEMWLPAEAGRIVNGMPHIPEDDGFIHRMRRETPGSTSLIRIITCYRVLVGPSSWRAVDEPVNCIHCLATDG